MPGRFAVARLPPEAPLPPWATAGALTSVTRTVDELSIVCDDDAVPSGVYAMRDFAALRVLGTIDFAVVGVLASMTRVLAEAGVSVFAFSTFDTDYLLVRTNELDRAKKALSSVAVLVDESQ
ncbi:MAG TPA: ACT domain-containing protein [Polyangia bacterium]|nr:ACT domain-containing protein [Polyangia bacterium]